MKPKKKFRKKRSISQKTQINRHHKDRLFRFVFREKRHLLALYNALRGTDYQDENQLQITTLDGTIYLGMKNDLSFVIDSVMNLYEHQSTWNPNMPLRGLLYFSKLYQAYVKEQGLDLYGSRRITLPFPQYIVFYNGTDEQPDRKELRLSEAFCQPAEITEIHPAPCLECCAVMLNINQGHNRELMEKCRRLWEYAEFIAKIREYQEMGMELSAAMDTAVDYCLKNEILTDILIRSKAEVLDMLLEEYDEKKTMEYLRKEAREIGREEGWAEGRKRLNALNQRLIDEERFDDLKRSVHDKAFQEELLKHYGL